jgi:hypothetical protein
MINLLLWSTSFVSFFSIFLLFISCSLNAYCRISSLHLQTSHKFIDFSSSSPQSPKHFQSPSTPNLTKLLKNSHSNTQNTHKQ